MAATRAVALAVGLLAACSSSKRETMPCADALSGGIVPALESTLGGGDANAFHHATEDFQQGTMCGPDMAAAIRDWEDALREPDAAKAASQRRDVLAHLATIVSAYEWVDERHVLAPLLAKAKVAK